MNARDLLEEFDMSGAGRPKLSAVLIVRNEEAMLAGALESVRGVADEIVVVDTGSADATREIARRHNVALFQCDWKDSFAQARNEALACVRGDWILWLDAPERLDAASAAELRSIVARNDRGKAYLAYIEVPASATGGAAERVGRVRLVPNRPGLQFQGRVRETLKPALARLGMSVEATGIVLRRTAREHQPEIKRAKALRDLRLIERELREQGPTPRLVIAHGEIQATLANHAVAAECFKSVIQSAPRGSTEMLEAWYGLLTTFDAAQSDQQLSACLQALEIFPFDAQLLCAMGNYLQAKGRTDLACRAYETVVRYGQVNPETWHLAEIGEVAAMCLSTTWQLQNQVDKARAAMQEALARFPNSLRLRRSLIELEVKQGNLLAALGETDKLPASFPHREAFRSAIRGGCQGARGNWIPALAYLETAYTAGCREPLCLRWLALALWVGDRKQEAEPILREWQAVEPQNAEVRRYLEEIARKSATAPMESAAAQPAGQPIGETLDDGGWRIRVDGPEKPLEITITPPHIADAPAPRPASRTEARR
jgi:tetratricopeptide (TPR) repeat protein